MGSEPQHTKFPDLSLAQDIFILSNDAASEAAKERALQRVRDGISEHKMAPLYRCLAHPSEGILNSLGQGSIGTSTNSKTTRPAHEAPAMLARRQSNQNVTIPWDESLYTKLVREVEEELEQIQKQEQDAQEQEGDQEVQVARGKRAELYARIGDKDKAISAYEALLEKTGPLGTRIDLILAIIRVALFFSDRPCVKRYLDRASGLIDSGGDWDRRNRFKAYQGIYLLTVRSYDLAAPLLLDSLSTFTSYELCSYSSLVVYAVLAGSISLKRVDFKAKVVDAPEIRAILGDGEEKLAALVGSVSAGQGADASIMSDTTHTSATPTAKAAVNLTTLGSNADPAESEQPLDFTPLAGLVRSLHIGDYKPFFLALAAVEVEFLNQDRYLYEHRGWFVREMRLRAYQQLLQSYRVVGLKSMAQEFGVSVDYLDSDLAKFIAADRIACTIDRVNGIIETNRPDDKNKQYTDIVKQGDSLITRLQKYGQAVRLRGSERG